MQEIGEYLRREREARGVSLAQIHDVTKIRIHYLEAIERGEFDRLPGETYVRGFLRNYARAIGIDDAAVLERYKAARAAAEKEAGEQAAPTGDGPAHDRPKDGSVGGNTKAEVAELLRTLEERRRAERSALAARTYRVGLISPAAAADAGLSPRVRARRALRRRRLWQLAIIVGAVAFLIGLWTGARQRADQRPPAASVQTEAQQTPPSTSPDSRSLLPGAEAGEPAQVSAPPSDSNDSNAPPPQESVSGEAPAQPPSATAEAPAGPSPAPEGGEAPASQPPAESDVAASPPPAAGADESPADEPAAAADAQAEAEQTFSGPVEAL